MTTVARITDSSMFVESELDEVTISIEDLGALSGTEDLNASSGTTNLNTPIFSFSLTAFYADEFDEVSTTSVALRRMDDGSLIISGEFDEVTGINFSLQGDLMSLTGTEDLQSGSGSLDLST